MLYTDDEPFDATCHSIGCTCILDSICSACNRHVCIFHAAFDCNLGEYTHKAPYQEEQEHIAECKRRDEAARIGRQPATGHPRSTTVQHRTPDARPPTPTTTSHGRTGRISAGTEARSIRSLVVKMSRRFLVVKKDYRCVDSLQHAVGPPSYLR